jgi:tRNA nucleotidyltransferase (CCA-adding enzyme)
MDAPHWEHFEHEADIGVRGIGGQLHEAFEQAGLALTAVITDPDTVRARQSLQLECSADDNDYLFYEWLNQLIYLMATEHMLFSRFEVKLDHHRLQATVWGEALDRQRHQPVVEIKGATLTELCVRQRDDGSWLAQTIVDV